ncbi:KRAB domain-containing zinc finger protein [Fusarium oxysporum f. sp. melonis 26406]|uniref:KRAB domain-containing zinc finger protein n=1 Tax=Fusarium oxysporum f. sp. melonis 26406 TaxID=1089452 RepID=W9YY12_FUSOX|nr:KRAB domain-containing zinc finger protein [Fusarium oxysporum f. sp. melonis 26406]
MEVTELIEEQLTARPFQCGWQSCTKSFNRKSDLQRHYRIHTNERPYACSISECGKSFIQRSALTIHIRTHTGEKPHQCQQIDCGKRFSDSSSLARHRRVHTGKRPYKCTYDGCSKSFCRKATMVEHQRRSNQYGMDPNDILYDCSSDSEDDEPPLTPQHSSMTWSPRDIVSMEQAISNGPLHRATSYADFGQQVHGQHMSQQYVNRQGIPSNAPQEFHCQPIPDYYVGAPTLHRTTTMPCQMYYVTEQGNPGVVTMTNAAQRHYRLPRQVERPPVELPYSTSAIATSIQSSPRNLSVTSVSSPVAQECFFTYLPGNQPEYVQADLQHSIVQYQHPMQHLMSQSQPPVASQAHPLHAPAADHPPQKSAQAQLEQWSTNDPPIEVTTIGQLPAYGTAVYDPYGPKIEVDDPSMQLPSSRLASL